MEVVDDTTISCRLARTLSISDDPFSGPYTRGLSLARLVANIHDF